MINTDTRDSLIGKRFIDRRGIGCVVCKEIVKHPTNWKRDRVLLKFDNNTEKIYSKNSIVKQINGDRINIDSIISAYEFIGKKYMDKHKNHECTVMSVVKKRYTYESTVVKVKWDTGVETEHLLGKIIGSRIPYNRAIKKSNSNKYTLKPFKDFTWRYGGYCKIPENADIKYYPADAFTKWTAMMTRCYKKEWQEKAYENVEVCDEWKNFYNFGCWYSNNYIVDWVLDKDLKGLNHYGPDSCTFIPLKLNASLIIKPGSDKYPSGIYLTRLPGRKPYVSSISTHGHTVNCDYHNTVIDGFMCSKIVKEYYVEKLGEKIFSNMTKKYEFDVLQLCKNFQVHDKRYGNKDRITESDIIKYLQDKTKYNSDDYFKLRGVFVSQRYDFFKKRYDLIDQILNQEFN